MFLLSVLNFATKILEEKQIQVDLICVLYRLGRVCRLANHPVSYLRVENFLTLNAMLVLQRTAIFHEVVENFYHFFRLQHLAKVKF